MKLTSWFSKYSDAGILILRVGLAAIFFVHGFHKWSMWGVEPSEQLHSSMLTILRILSIAEPLAALALVIGYLTPVAIIGLMADMLGALNVKINIGHLQFMEIQTPGWEFEFILLVALLALLFTGPGRYSIEGRQKKA